MSTEFYLQKHLKPSGNTVMPSVLDSDLVGISFFDVAKRITDKTTVVDIGESPNSNTGDSMRTAFVKINNFMEASYWADRDMSRELDMIKARLVAGGL